MTPYELMTDEEKVAFTGLLRLMIRMDGVLSPQEVATISALAREIETPGLWSLMNETSLLERDELVEHVDQVRPQMRRWIHGILTRVAQSDGMDESELELLWWLEKRWDLPRLP